MGTVSSGSGRLRTCGSSKTAPGGFRAQSHSDRSAMRKLISIVVALVFGVGVGLSSSELWLRASVLPYCKVAKDADAYHMRSIRVKAKVHFEREGMYISEDCDPNEALAALVEFEDGPILGPIYENDP